MLLSVLLLNFLVERSLSQPNTKQFDTKILLSTNLSPENPSYGTSNSPFQAQATVEVQVDRLDVSAVINLTRGAGSDVAGLTSDSPISGGFMLDVICTTNPLKMRTHLECCIWAYIYS